MTSRTISCLRWLDFMWSYVIFSCLKSELAEFDQNNLCFYFLLTLVLILRIVFVFNLWWGAMHCRKNEIGISRLRFIWVSLYESKDWVTSYHQYLGSKCFLSMQRYCCLRFYAFLSKYILLIIKIMLICIWL